MIHRNAAALAIIAALSASPASSGVCNEMGFMDWWAETMMDRTLIGFTLMAAMFLTVIFFGLIFAFAGAALIDGTWQPMAFIVITMAAMIVVQYRKAKRKT